MGTVIAACALAAVVAAGRAGGDDGTGAATDAPPLAWGVADDASKFADDGGAWFYGELAGAHLTENRWTLTWDPTDPTAIEELPFLERAAPKARAAGIRIVLVLYGKDPKVHPAAPFCSWAASVASTVSVWGIHDFVVWNEPNGPLYWQPQKDRVGRDLAAPAYERLLATCYDALHAADPAATVVGMGLAPRASRPAKANEPLSFLRDVGAVYRASGRTAPLMDQLALHPYPNPTSPVKGSPPQVGYVQANSFGIPDLARVKQAVYDAFAGTAQPTTLDGLTFRLDELGWQTVTRGYPQYAGRENARPPGAPWPVSEQTQAAFLADTVTHYVACDPTVTDVELFLLVDERYRNGRDATGAVVGGGWQSGLLTAGGEGVSTPKLAYGELAPLFAAGRAACSAPPVEWSPGPIVRETSTTTAKRAAMRRCAARFPHPGRRRTACVARVRKTFGG